MSAVPPWLIFSPRDPHIARPPPVATKHRRRAKENAPAILAASHDRGLSSAAAFARIAKRFETTPVLAQSGDPGMSALAPLLGASDRIETFVVCGFSRRLSLTAFDPKRLSRSVSLNLDDHLDFNRIVEGKCRHPYGRACVLSRLAEHVHHQIGKSVYYLWLVTKIIGGVDHPKDLYDALHVIQAADCGSHFRQHD